MMKFQVFYDEDTGLVKAVYENTRYGGTKWASMGCIGVETNDAVNIGDTIAVNGDAVTVTTPAPPPPIAPQRVDAERDRRMALGVTFNGKEYDSNADSRDYISGAAANAGLAVLAGAQAGDYGWAYGEGTEFTWVAKDNTAVKMDAQSMLAFGRATMAWVDGHIKAARALKSRDPIPTDYATNESYWP